MAFQNVRTASFDRPMQECIGDMLDRWAALAGRGRPVALREELVNVTLRITLRIIFSQHADARMAALVDAVD